MFLVVLHRSGPDYDRSLPLEEQSGWPEHAAFMDGLVEDGFIVLGGPLSDEHRVVHAVEAESPDAVRAVLGNDPWSGSHLLVDAIEPWTIRLDGRRLADRPPALRRTGKEESAEAPAPSRRVRPAPPRALRKTRVGGNPLDSSPLSRMQ